ncbi:aldehyde dehydrogenase (NADP(+)) [Fontivita pretiosa]|uniref:aldehyde dehydrogenase (NADP(+)) n=1 Tax=Fontivita pretiosa TaxID=2989684 RepID=UPI003D16F9D2
MAEQPVLIAGQWRAARAAGTFHAQNPTTAEPLPEAYPISTWEDCDAALAAAAEAAAALRAVPASSIAALLRGYAERIESHKSQIVEMAHLETGLPKSPRLADVELPRTTNQLRQAAQAAIEGSWALPTIDTKLNIRSCYAPLGPVCVFGPNNFPLAFNGIAGGDFAAAIAAGNPVIAKANPGHPGTTRLLAEQALAAVHEAQLPPATVQLIYRISHEDGQRLVSDPRLGGTGYTGSRRAGLALKAAADAAGKPIYLELSSINPVLILPAAIQQRAEKIADEFTDSCLLGSGQFCTNPGLVILLAGEPAERFVGLVKQRFESRPPTTLLGSGVCQALARSVATLRDAGASLITGGQPLPAPPIRFANTLLRVDGDRFLANPEKLQTEAFGNVSLFVLAKDVQQIQQILDRLEGNLTGCIYSATDGADDAMYDALAPRLRWRVGRLLNDKMPTGVAVSPAMNHGGPYPATGHPGFTAVGIPASLRRFAMLHCYDNVREHRLPPLLRNKNPTGSTWRLIDGAWTQADVPPQ